MSVEVACTAATEQVKFGKFCQPHAKKNYSKWRVWYRRFQGSLRRLSDAFGVQVHAKGSQEPFHTKPYYFEALPAQGINTAGRAITPVVLQVAPVLLVFSFAVTHARASLPIQHNNKAQILATLIQFFESSGIMLPMLGWVTLLSNHIATRGFHGCVISVQKGTCTAGQRL